MSEEERQQALLERASPWVRLRAAVRSFCLCQRKRKAGTHKDAPERRVDISRLKRIWRETFEEQGLAAGMALRSLHRTASAFERAMAEYASRQNRFSSMRRHVAMSTAAHIALAPSRTPHERCEHWMGWSSRATATKASGAGLAQARAFLKRQMSKGLPPVVMDYARTTNGEVIPNGGACGVGWDARRCPD